MSRLREKTSRDATDIQQYATPHTESLGSGQAVSNYCVRQGVFCATNFSVRIIQGESYTNEFRECPARTIQSASYTKIRTANEQKTLVSCSSQAKDDDFFNFSSAVAYVLLYSKSHRRRVAAYFGIAEDPPPVRESATIFRLQLGGGGSIIGRRRPNRGQLIPESPSQN